MNLLIVDDDVIEIQVICSIVKREKLGIDQIFQAYRAAQAQRIIESERVDLILCDIEMPGENGLELLRWVRENREEMECVFLTCHASFKYAQEAISLGCQDYILIPAKYEDIGAVILKVVRRLEERRKARRYQEYGKYMLKEQLRQEDNGGKMPPEEVAEEVSACIIKNLRNSSLSVDRLAEQFHFHPVYFNRMFKKVKGVSVSQFIINERMKLAASLLETGRYNANEVSDKVGYSHYPNFYNMFKKYYGISPSQYQEDHRKN